MQGVVERRSLYFEPSALADMPDHCQVVALSPLIHSLMTEAVALPVRYDREGRSGALMHLIQYEIGMLSVLPLFLPLDTYDPERIRPRRISEVFVAIGA